MTYKSWLNQVRVSLRSSGEPQAELLVAKASNDLPGMYMAGESASMAASRLHRYRANPVSSGVVVGVIAAAAALAWLLWPKKKEAAAPTTIQPPIVDVTPRNATTPVVVPIGVFDLAPPGICALTEAQFLAWGAKADRAGAWLPATTTTPPNAAALKAQFPNLALVPPERLSAMTNNGQTLWLYSASGVPSIRLDAQANICAWAKDPSTPILNT